jgi:hypothetical protein
VSARTLRASRDDAQSDEWRVGAARRHRSQLPIDLLRGWHVGHPERDLRRIAGVAFVLCALVG